MIKAVLFDLDGVLIDADKWHFNAFNIALQHTDVEPISWQEHLTIYKGIPTRKKLGLLTERKGLSKDQWETVYRSKQEITEDIITKFCFPDPEKIEMMRLLKRKYKIGVCSNAIRKSLDMMLERSGLAPLVDFTLSNQDIQCSKPDPMIYHAAFEKLKLSPQECVIVEDSDVGRQAAIASGGVLCSVNGPEEVNYYRILKTILEADQVNVVIPAAGQGKRFSECGYQHPKPLIDVDGKPMIKLVLDNLRGLGRPVLIFQKRHLDKYHIEAITKHYSPDSHIIGVDGLTEGAACTVLLAKSEIDNANELIIANSDQLVNADLEGFIEEMRNRRADGGILTFRDNDPKWSFAKADSNGLVVEVAEKKAISEHATVGIYYFRQGSDFVKYANQMIAKNIRVNNEFYVCPVFNEFIGDGKKIYIHEIEKSCMHGLGTPEDLEKFLQVSNPSKNQQTQIIELNAEINETELPQALLPCNLVADTPTNDR